jgi:hypothetical protein
MLLERTSEITRTHLYDLCLNRPVVDAVPSCLCQLAINCRDERLLLHPVDPLLCLEIGPQAVSFTTKVQIAYELTTLVDIVRKTRYWLVPPYRFDQVTFHHSRF